MTFLHMYLFILLLALFYSDQSAAQPPTPQHCPAGQHWVRAFHRNAYIRADGTQVSASNVVAHCADNPPAYAILEERLKNGKPSDWLTKNEKAKRWGDGERDRILEALGALPKELLSESVRGIYRLEKSIPDDTNPGKRQPGEIAVYDLAFSSKSNLSRILAHEFAHEIYSHSSDSTLESYRKAADWLLVRLDTRKPDILIPNRDEYVQEDGKESLSEDFANNIEYFLFESPPLKQKNPKIYEWIQKQFGVNFKLAKDSRK